MITIVIKLMGFDYTKHIFNFAATKRMDNILRKKLHFVAITMSFVISIVFQPCISDVNMTASGNFVN